MWATRKTHASLLPLFNPSAAHLTDLWPVVKLPACPRAWGSCLGQDQQTVKGRAFFALVLSSVFVNCVERLVFTFSTPWTPCWEPKENEKLQRPPGSDSPRYVCVWTCALCRTACAISVVYKSNMFVLYGCVPACSLDSCCAFMEISLICVLYLKWHLMMFVNLGLFPHMFSITSCLLPAGLKPKVKHCGCWCLHVPVKPAWSQPTLPMNPAGIRHKHTHTYTHTRRVRGGDFHLKHTYSNFLRFPFVTNQV